MSIFSSETKNQHYVSQVEQRVNASNKNASNENMKIYRFSRVNLDGFSDGELVKIEKNQCDYDLYTLASQGDARKNLENLMNGLETNYLRVVENIERSCENHKSGKCEFFIDLDDMKKILALKFLTKFRNPHFIKETLRISPFTANLILDDDRHLEALISLYKAKNNIIYLSKKYNVTTDEYISWLNTLVGLLLPTRGENLLLGMVDEVLNSPELGKKFRIYYYDEDCVLLPDCGTIDLAQEDFILYCFNVTSKIFIILFMPVLKCFGSLKPNKRINDNLIKKIKEKHPKLTEKEIEDIFEAILKDQMKVSIRYFNNITEMLDCFNEYVKLHSKQNFFSSSELGITE